MLFKVFVIREKREQFNELTVAQMKSLLENKTKKK